MEQQLDPLTHRILFSMRTMRFLRALTSITLAFSFFITPLAPVLAQTTTTDPSTQPATDTSTVDQSAPQTPAPDTTVAPESSAPSTSDAGTSNQPQGKGTKDTTAADSATDQKAQKQPNDNSKKSPTTPEQTVTTQDTQTPAASGPDYNVGLKYLTPKVNEENGTLTYTYPVTLPPGRNGLTPDLSLTYQSDNRDQMNTVGYGWRLFVIRVPLQMARSALMPIRLAVYKGL